MIFLRNKARSARKAHNVTAIYELIVKTSDGQLAARGLIYSDPAKSEVYFKKP
jgi:hypothetical protein